MTASKNSMALQNPPTITPVINSGESRPFWSVMIPSFNPQRIYLEQTLHTVLQQDPGPKKMQIEVVDDCSGRSDVMELVKSIGGDRVKFSKTPRNLGLAGCWNTCIERSRGEWVHILHQDDWVLPEFYARFEALNNYVPEMDAAFARFMDAYEDGHWKCISKLEMRTAGELKGFDRRIASWQCVQCVAAVVKRATYERLGGYRSDIPYVLDWEMWCRITVSGRWGYVPQPGAAYRIHPESETARLRRSGKHLKDFLAGGSVARSHFSHELQRQTAPTFQNNFAFQLLEQAASFYVRGNLKEAKCLLDSFGREALKSARWWDWSWLRLRVFLKLMRLLFSRA
jgi:glycosyltransferase involved in cell wall biosynthesis